MKRWRLCARFVASNPVQQQGGGACQAARAVPLECSPIRATSGRDAGSRIVPQLLSLRRWFASLPEHTVLQMPALSPTMSQGNVTRWQVKEGDEIAAGDVLAEIETDKATLEWENQDDGFIAKILVQAGAKDIAVGTPLAVVVDESDKVGAFSDYSADSAPQQPEQNGSGAESDKEANRSESSEASEESKEEDSQPSDGLRRVGPAALRLLRERGLSEKDVRPTGPRGVITKADVLSATKQSSGPKAETKGEEPKKPKQEAKGSSKSASSESAPSSKGTAEPEAHGSMPEGYKDVPNSQIRKIIAQRLLESKQTVPHYYVQAHANLESVTALRQTLKSQGTKVSVNDFVVRAVALALQEVPGANATWDAKSKEPKPSESVDVAIAVATDKGLITPIIKAANTKSLQQISEEVRELAGKARANKLKPEEFQGGTFTISNLGMYNIDDFSAIINPPQAGILAVGGTQQDISLVDGRPVSRASMVVTLSADQRVFDGETTASFLEAVKGNLANPVKLLV